MWWKCLAVIIIGFGGGFIISAGVFAFITIIGIIPRLAQYTKTRKYLRLYEDVIVAGGFLASTAIYIDYYLPIGTILIVIYSLGIGIFVGCLSVAIAEVLDVIPIMSRREHLQPCVGTFIVTLGIGKAIGAIIFFVIEGFYV